MPKLNDLIELYSQQLAYPTLINFLDQESSRLRKEALIARNNAIYNLNKCSQYASLLTNKNQFKKHLNKRFWSFVKKSQYWEKEVPKFDDQQFKNTFRVSRDTFNYIKGRLKHLIRQQTRFRSPIDLDKRLAIALYVLGSTREYRAVASLFGVGRTTVGEIVAEICQEIFTIFKSDHLYGYPPTSERIEQTVSGFEMLGFPQCFGVIDSYHIKVQPPKQQSADYYNLNGWPSVVLLAVVDYNHNFTYLNVGSPGSMTDSSIFDKSKLKIEHQFNPLFKDKSLVIQGVKIPILLVGGAAFRLSDILLTPYTYKVAQAHHEIIFNNQLFKCTIVTGVAFGQLKTRFRRIEKGLEVSIETVNNIIKACCILHNICNNRNDTFEAAWLKEPVIRIRSPRIQPRTMATEEDVFISEGNTIRNAISIFLAGKENDASASSVFSSVIGSGADNGCELGNGTEDADGVDISLSSED